MPVLRRTSLVEAQLVNRCLSPVVEEALCPLIRTSSSFMRSGRFFALNSAGKVVEVMWPKREEEAEEEKKKKKRKKRRRKTSRLIIFLTYAQCCQAPS